jgi:hypothetical protein
MLLSRYWMLVSMLVLVSLGGQAAGAADVSVENDGTAGGVANLVEIAVASISSGLSLSRHAARSMQ